MIPPVPETGCQERREEEAALFWLGEQRWRSAGEFVKTCRSSYCPGHEMDDGWILNFFMSVWCCLCAVQVWIWLWRGAAWRREVQLQVLHGVGGGPALGGGH